MVSDPAPATSKNPGRPVAMASDRGRTLASASDYVMALLPVLLALAVNAPILRNFFFGDDFVNLYAMANDPRSLAFLLKPHGGHLCEIRNLFLYGAFKLFGADPRPYLAISLFTHAVNVFLLFLVVRELTHSRRLACLCAILWGTSFVNEGTVGWIAVYGQTLLATIVLIFLHQVLRVARGAAEFSLRAGVLWYFLLIAGAMSFGMGMAIAMLSAPTLYLLLPSRAGHRSPGVAFLPLLVVIPALYIALNWLYGHLFGTQPLGLSLFLLYGLSFWKTVVQMFIGLLSYGTRAFLLGFVHPMADDALLSYAVGALVLAATVVIAVRSESTQRRQILAFSLLAVSCYAMIAAGRAPLFDVMMGHSNEWSSSQPRYHYVNPLFLCLVVALILRHLASAVPRAWKTGALSLALILPLASSWLNTPWIKHRDRQRQETARALAEIQSAIDARPPGTTVVIRNQRFPFGGMAGSVLFPGRAGLFIIFHPHDTVDGRLVRFVDADPAVLAMARRARGQRIHSLIVGPNEVPSLKAP
jgi:hypothetical protein